MTDRSLIFPADEFRARVAVLQSRMAADGADALLLTTAADIFYVTGFLTRFWESPARPWFVIVPAQGDPTAVIPGIGAELMGQTWITDIRTWAAPDPNDDGVTLLADTLADLTPSPARIATPMGLETQLRMPLADYHRLAAALGPRQITDGTAIVQRTREIKSPAEVAKIQDICTIAGRAFDRLPEIALPGRPLDAVFRDFQGLLLAEGADWVSYTAGGAGPQGYADVISPARAVPLAKGDVLMLDTGAVKDGYFCDFDRNVFIGTPSDAVRRAQDALWEATEHVLATLRPGHLASDVHRMFTDALAERGHDVPAGRLGHGLGLTLTEWPSFTPLDQTELHAGMVLTLEPSAFVTSQTFLTHEENIVLHEDGCRLLSPRAPRTLPVLGA